MIWQVGPVSIVPEEVFVQGFDSLRLLNLEENQFEYWEEILKLSQLKRSNNLTLLLMLMQWFGSESKNVISSNNNAIINAWFALLQCICLTDCLFNCWQLGAAVS